MSETAPPAMAPAPPPPPRRRRVRKLPIILGIIVALIIVLVGVWNWDWFIPIVESRAGAATGRAVTIEHLHVNLGWTTTARLTGITIQNPKDFPADQAPLAKVGELTVKVNILDYIRHQIISVPEIDIDHLDANARQLADGKNNYTLATSSSKNANQDNSKPPRIGVLNITDGHAVVVMPKFKSDFTMTIDTQPAPADSKYPGNRIHITATGTYAGQPVDATFVGGSLLSLSDKTNPYPIDFRVRNGKTEASLIGTVSQPVTFGGADLMLKFSGQDMSSLYPLTGVPIPKTPPFNIQGRFVYADKAFKFENFTGRVGSSDLEGTIAEKPASPRRQITADLSSHRVDLTDLAGFLGGTPGKASTPGQDAATKRQMAKAAASPHLLPTTKINIPRLKTADFDVHYKGEHIINKNVPLDDLVVHLRVIDGRIIADPLNFGVGGGTIASRFDLDPVGDTLKTRASIDFRKIDLSRLMAATHTFTGNGTIGGDAALDTTGDSVSTMLGRGNGHLQLFMGQGGDLSALLVDLAGLQFGDGVLSALGVPRKTTIQCFISDFGLTDGLVNTKAFLVATKEANILGSGTVNLATEKLDLKMRTEATHFSIGSLSTPIDIGGTLKSPGILPAVGPLAAKAGAAVGLGILFPPAALLPTIRLGLGDKNACVDTLQAVHNGSAAATK